uniref:AUGMIN subunit 5-like n=1 Tax=Erigeron canadensis TaxID=72917 RepID=UPI001CB8E13C|nr:AUGMIN subunit 5-like [Erigeron canadensis]
MQSSVIHPESIIDWLQNEMEYRPSGLYINSSMPSPDSIRRVCRGNMVPVFEFLTKRVKSKKTVDIIRRNILVHGKKDNAGGVEGTKSVESRKMSRGGKRKAKISEIVNENDKETALQERETAQKDVERLRHVVRRKRKELKSKMLEVSREEADRKRMLDERSNYRHKQVILEAYDSHCDETARIFAQYQKHLCYYVNQAKDAQGLEIDYPVNGFQAENEKGWKAANDVFHSETSKERDIRMACESLAVQMIEKVHNLFPAYEGVGIHLNPQLEIGNLGIDVEGDIPNEVRDVILSCLKSPHQLLLDITAYTQRLKYLIAKETEKNDAITDAETLRYKYENNRLMDASPDLGSPLQLQLYGNGNNGIDMSSKGTRYLQFQRQKAHVQQFVATEDQLNKAAEARSACQKLLKRLYGSSDADPSLSFSFGRTSQSMSSLRQLELDVWAMEREAAGRKASLTILTSEVQRLNLLRDERKEVESSLNKKRKKIEEFDARRLELKSISDALMRANTDAASFWSHQPLAAMEHASNTIIPACTVVINKTNSVKDLIDEEVSTFTRCPDNSLYVLPSTLQGLLKSMGPSCSTGSEAIADAERNAALLTARAGAGDPSAIPSICRISATLQYPAGFEGSEDSLASVLGSMEFCLKLRGSEACVLEELLKAVNLVHIRRDLVNSGHALLTHAYDAQNAHKSTTSHLLNQASEQERIIMDKWLPEIKSGIANTRKSLNDCKYVDALLDEWWEQPGSTIVDWVTVDGQNVAAWHNHVKQLLTYYDKELRESS